LIPTQKGMFFEKFNYMFTMNSKYNWQYDLHKIL
jgi:hypothetical protein